MTVREKPGKSRGDNFKIMESEKKIKDFDMNIQSPDTGLLIQIYSLYHEATDTADTVCKEKCASCCTCNVTLTSLETEFIVNSLDSHKKNELQNRIQQRFPEKHYIPKMTTNMFARMCMENNEIPDEENDPAFGICPLLENDLCAIYETRPFGCRALMSEIPCREGGYARLPPLVLTLNTIFLQVIEHLDQKGVFGNLSDMVLFFLSKKTQADRADQLGFIRDERLFVQNEKIPVLMVPPKHQKELKPLIGKLFNLLKK